MTQPLGTDVQFADKIALDKNFGFDTILYEGKQEFKYDLERTYEIPAEDITDMLNFCKKRFYDSPLIDIPFTQTDYAQFVNRSIQYFRRSKNILSAAERDNRWDNQLEKLLYRMLERNLIRKSIYHVPSTGRKYETNEKLSLLERYIKVNQAFPDKVIDHRQTEYIAELSPLLKENLCTFLFYTSLKDYQFVIKEFYRNPNMRFLFIRLSNLLNNTKASINDSISFDEAVRILGYNLEARQAKPKVKAAINKLLELPSLQGLSVYWPGTGYQPRFEINNSLHENELNESRHDKFKRLDMLILTKLKPFLVKEPVTRNLSFLDVKMTLNSNSTIYGIVENCFEKLRIKPAPRTFETFFNDMVYTDDHKNQYASNLVRHCLIGGQTLYQADDRYRNRVTIL